MMLTRKLRYGIVDLSHRSVSVEEAVVETIGTFEDWMNDQNQRIKLFDPAVILSTGLLTGSGAPGTGAMTWTVIDGNSLTASFSEGRIGAYLRYAGIDALIICGKSEADVSLVINEHAICIEDLPSNADMGDLEAKYGNENGTIATVKAEGIWEDDHFIIAEPFIANRLYESGLKAISVTGTGALSIADGGGFAELCSILWNICYQDDGHAPKHAQRARFLSVKSTDDYPVLDDSDRLYAALGIIWPDFVQPSKRYFYTLRLIQSLVSREAFEEVKKALSSYFMPMSKEILEGGGIDGE